MRIFILVVAFSALALSASAQPLATGTRENVSQPSLGIVTFFPRKAERNLFHHVHETGRLTGNIDLRMRGDPG